jgi:hypothetical protein
VLFKTEEERLMAQKEFKLKQQQTYVLPYGVERAAAFDKAAAQAEIRKRHNLKMEDKILLFAGTLDYAPNAQAVTLLYEKIEPLLRTKLSNFKILICGRNQFPEYGYLKKLHNENIIQAGQVPDIETYFTVTDVFLNPVQNVHGVQTKLFDALNFNLNVVSFKKAANEVPAYLHQKVFMSGEGDYEGFVQNVLATLTVTFDTPEAFYQEFSWERIVANFVTHLKNQEAST